jgi:hypothetical protein
MLLLWIKVDSFSPIIFPNLNPICHLLALGSHHILHVGRIRVKELNELPVATNRVDNDSIKIYSTQRHPGYKVRITS